MDIYELESMIRGLLGPAVEIDGNTLRNNARQGGAVNAASWRE